MNGTRHVVGVLLALTLALLLVAPAQARSREHKRERKGQVVFSFGVSAYQGSDTVGLGWLAEVGVGYQFNEYFTTMLNTGYGHYAIEDDRPHHDGSRGVDFVPLMLTGTVSLAPNFPICPYLEAGGGTTFTKLEGDDAWEASPSVEAGGGVNINAGPLNFSAGASYVIQDVDDFSDGYWSYGVGGGVGWSGAF